MSDFVLHKGKRAADEVCRHYGSSVESITHAEAARPKIQLADGRIGAGSCLGCGSTPCMTKAPSELALPGRLEAFPGDPSLDVCPTSALAWERTDQVVVVQSAACIGCGLCVVRCPYGAITFDGASAKVEASDPDALIVASASNADDSTPDRKGTIASLTRPGIADLPTTIGTLDDSRTALLVRNLLHEIGINARVRRRGDTNVRMDGAGFSSEQKAIVIEIEFSSAVIESPRALLEDVAVLHARYGYDVAAVDPLSVVVTLPNIRSEYYQVIRDIEKVLGVKCRTMSLGALMGQVWRFGHLQGFGNDAFATSTNEVDLTSGVAALQGAPEPYSGAFRPSK